MLVDTNTIRESLLQMVVNKDHADTILLNGCGQHWVPLGIFLQLIGEAPPVDAQVIVRCKDCKNWERDLYDEDSDSCFCAMIDLRTGPEFFCADGEREGEKA